MPLTAEERAYIEARKQQLLQQEPSPEERSIDLFGKKEAPALPAPQSQASALTPEEREYVEQKKRSLSERIGDAVKDTATGIVTNPIRSTREALSSASFGLSKSAEAAARAALSPRTYDQVRADIDESQRQFQEEEPGAYMVTKLGGALGGPGLGGTLENIPVVGESLASAADAIGAIPRDLVYKGIPLDAAITAGRVGQHVADIARGAPARKDMPYTGLSPQRLIRQMAQGASLGHADEIEAYLRSKGSDRPYEDIHQEIRADNRAYEDANFWTALALQAIPGFFTGGLGAGKLALKAPQITQKLSPALRRVGGGAGIGAVAGHGYADPGERGTGAALGAGLGGAMGGAFGLLGSEPIQKYVRDIGHGVASKFPLKYAYPHKKMAALRLQSAMKKDNIPPHQQIHALRNLSEGETPADISPRMRAHARALLSENPLTQERGVRHLYDRIHNTESAMQNLNRKVRPTEDRHSLEEMLAGRGNPVHPIDDFKPQDVKDKLPKDVLNPEDRAAVDFFMEDVETDLRAALARGDTDVVYKMSDQRVREHPVIAQIIQHYYPRMDMREGTLSARKLLSFRRSPEERMVEDIVPTFTAAERKHWDWMLQAARVRRKDNVPLEDRFIDLGDDAQWLEKAAKKLLPRSIRRPIEFVQELTTQKDQAWDTMRHKLLKGNLATRDMDIYRVLEAQDFAVYDDFLKNIDPLGSKEDLQRARNMLANVNREAEIDSLAKSQRIRERQEEGVRLVFDDFLREFDESAEMRTFLDRMVANPNNSPDMRTFLEQLQQRVRRRQIIRATRDALGADEPVDAQFEPLISGLINVPNDPQTMMYMDMLRRSMPQNIRARMSTRRVPETYEFSDSPLAYAKDRFTRTVTNAVTRGLINAHKKAGVDRNLDFDKALLVKEPDLRALLGEAGWSPERITGYFKTIRDITRKRRSAQDIMPETTYIRTADVPGFAAQAKDLTGALQDVQTGAHIAENRGLVSAAGYQMMKSAADSLARFGPGAKREELRYLMGNQFVPPAGKAQQFWQNLKQRAQKALPGRISDRYGGDTPTEELARQIYRRLSFQKPAGAQAAASVHAGRVAGTGAPASPLAPFDQMSVPEMEHVQSVLQALPASTTVAELTPEWRAWLLERMSEQELQTLIQEQGQRPPRSIDLFGTRGNPR